MKLKKILSGILIASAALACLYVQTDHYTLASEAKKETVQMRILNTTDLHGQLNSKDYAKNTDAKNMGMARVFDLIIQKKSELPSENVFTLDAGDMIFDYTTEYIYAENQYEIQPALIAMSYMGYDAITLGNHEFDYGYEYLLRQLNATGLRDITVVSNLTDSKTGEFPFHENMLLTRKMKTTDGKEVEVTVGILGETIPTLTSKTHSYAGILKTEDIVSNATAQAKKLKEMGADIIIALAHTGMGPENPEENFKNVAYALTKIDEIDVIVCGHEHNEFPTNDKTSPYLSLPGVDQETWLVNGKNLVMAADRGEALGVVDLTLEVINGEVEIVNRSTKLEHVTEKNTTEDSFIAGLFDKWETEFDTYASETIGEVAKDELLHNYFGMIGDSKAIQLLNDSKRSFAQYYVQTNAKEYAGYPIIAASTYASFGVNSYEDYINISNEVTEASLASLQPYNNYLYVYKITGAQLKEWLEWSASAYETIGAKYEWKDKTIQGINETTGLRPLLREEWMDDWSSFFVFDGITYEINPSVEPRYNISGTKINSTNRISSMKYNGEDIKSTDVLLIATNKITKPMEANKGIDSQVVAKGFHRSQEILSDYIRILTANGGKIDPVVDYNWTVKLPANYKFTVKVSEAAKDLFEKTKWYDSYITTVDNYKYYTASITNDSTDTEAPLILSSQLKTKPTGSKYQVAVSATDESKIAYLRYRVGDTDLSYTGWHSARELSSTGTFLVHNNGIYTIYAEDIYGNKTIKKINITNISEDVHIEPVVETYTNRKTKISGSAEPNTTLYIEAQGKTYETKVNGSGKFSYSLPAQPSGSTVVVYTKDVTTGKMSEEVSVLVKRTGPNAPTIDTISNNKSFISGNLNDEDAQIMFMVEDTVYVSDQGGKDLYLKCELYDSSKTIVEVQIDVNAGNEFVAVLPALNAGTSITIYNIDHISRLSRKVTKTVAASGPNAPVLYEVSNIESVISGYIPEAKKKEHDILIEVGNREFNITSNKSGEFTVETGLQLYAGQEIKITAYLTENGVKKTSHTTTVKVADIEEHVRSNSVILSLGKVTNKSNYVTGTFTEDTTLYIAICSGTGENFTSTLYETSVEDSERIMFELPAKLKEGMTVYAMSRHSNGKILIAAKTEVQAGRPDAPSFVGGINNSNKNVVVASMKDCTIVLKVGKKSYTQTAYEYDSVTGDYIYKFEIDRVASGTSVSVTATNGSGTSDVYSTTVEKVAPDAPTVNAVNAGDKLITGKVEMLSKDTSIYAKVGNKTYQGVVKEDGSFEIEVSKVAKNASISVYGLNGTLRGPLTKVVLSAKEQAKTIDTSDVNHSSEN